MATDYAASLGLTLGDEGAAAGVLQAFQDVKLKDAQEAVATATSLAGDAVNSGLKYAGDKVNEVGNGIMDKLIAWLKSLFNIDIATRIVYAILGVGILLLAIYFLMRPQMQEAATQIAKVAV